MTKTNLRIVAIFIFSMIFIGCSQTPYEVNSANALHNVKITVDENLNIISEEKEIFVSLLINEDSSYQAIITNTENSLSWTSNLKKTTSNRYESENLAITDTASFPLGNYKVDVRDEDGLLVSVDTTLKQYNFPEFTFINSELTYDDSTYTISLSEYNYDELLGQKEIKSGLLEFSTDATKLVFTAIDGEKNKLEYIVIL